MRPCMVAALALLAAIFLIAGGRWRVPALWMLAGSAALVAGIALRWSEWAFVAMSLVAIFGTLAAIFRREPDSTEKDAGEFHSAPLPPRASLWRRAARGRRSRGHKRDVD